jgi:hypothetical protein
MVEAVVREADRGEDLVLENRDIRTMNESRHSAD